VHNNILKISTSSVAILAQAMFSQACILEVCGVMASSIEPEVSVVVHGHGEEAEHTQANSQAETDGRKRNRCLLEMIIRMNKLGMSTEDIAKVVELSEGDVISSLVKRHRAESTSDVDSEGSDEHDACLPAALTASAVAHRDGCSWRAFVPQQQQQQQQQPQQQQQQQQQQRQQQQLQEHRDERQAALLFEVPPAEVMPADAFQLIKKRKYPSASVVEEKAAALCITSLIRTRVNLEMNGRGAFLRPMTAMPILKELIGTPVTPNTLARSGLAREVSRYMAHPNLEIKTYAQKITNRWRQQFRRCKEAAESGIMPGQSAA
jgi:hypothetical protein